MTEHHEKVAGLITLLDKVHEVCANVVMDTPDEQALHDKHVQQARDITQAIGAAWSANCVRWDALRAAFDPDELECVRLGLPCTHVREPDAWCRACRIRSVIDIEETP